tara:strand:- start:1846 stop:2040 length:195 start_codon:yes stop_codon:yes gene_type:complete
MVLKEKNKQGLDKIREKWTYEFGKFQLTVKEDMSFEDFLLWYVDMLDGEFTSFVDEMKRKGYYQ